MRLLPGFFLLSALAWSQTCAPASVLRPADSIAGALTEADCRLADGTLSAEYILTLPTVGQLQLNAVSSDFDVTLLLRDSAGRKIDAGAAIQRTMERGEYTVIVNATKTGQTGKFTLDSAFKPEPNTLCREFTRIGPGQSVSGRLTDDSCRLLNNAPFEGYRVTLFGAGTLDLSFTSPNFSGLVILRDEDGHALASDPLSISVSVLGGDYSILAAAAGAAARGDYSLTVKFTPAEGETCRPLKTLQSSEDVKGSITAASCAFGEGLLFNYYDLNLTEAGFADLRVAAAGRMATLIAVLDRAGRLVSEDFESGGENRPILGQQLPAGAYTVLVLTQSEGGDYTLQYRFTPGPPAICPVLELGRDAPQAGSLAASSCRYVNAMQDVYTFTTPAAGTIDVTLASADFYGTLVLRDAKDNSLARSDASDSAAARIVAALPAGSWSVGALSLFPGAYNITYKFTPGEPPVCPAAKNLGLNAALFGDLGESSCRGTDGQAADSYEFTLPAAGMTALFMTSSELNSYMTLSDSQGSILRRDDDSYGAPDAMILQYLPAGTYRIQALASGGSQSGRYRVDALFAAGDRPAGCLPKGDLAPGTLQAALHFTSCLYRDNTFADIYRLNVTESGNLNISMTSNAFDSYLELLDEQGSVIDDSGVTAQLTSAVEPGTYYVAVKPFADQGYSVGQYELVVK
ncbi:MAG TPA: PPC domain-containing protein [Bryobacteraceae bacterium]|nr:PPC domain-containing protein [Bryobacteraceae bacterium]